MQVELNPDQKWSEETLALFLGKSTETLKRYRRERTGPAFIRVGRTPQYLVKDVMVWMLQNRVEPTESATAQDAGASNV
jgi:AraC-like DNA-binding protein